MASPTLTLALIAKNEEKNINRLLDSVDGCFDEIILVDTGSTDKTKEIGKERGCKVYDFTWVNDFSKARNFAFSHASSDYIMWLDLDDVLGDRDHFIHWKKSAMEFADCWFATYHYALDPQGKPVISFVRERVFKRSLSPAWQYPLHEGIILKPEWNRDYAVSWSVKHMRDQEDVKQDRSRNITILENLKKSGDFGARLQFYYGKELFENSKPAQAVIEFEKALSMPDLEPHDKLIAYQYASYACQAMGDMIKDDLREEKNRWYDKAIEFALSGLRADVSRAEYYVSAGDTYLKKGELLKALPMYGAAKNCLSASMLGSPYAGAVFDFGDCYGLSPSLQIAKILFNIGKIEAAEKEAKDCVEKFKSQDAQNILNEIQKIKPLITIDNNQEQTEDIVISCPPGGAYPFDEEIYKTKPLGGSETALVRMAQLLKQKTKRKVIVFNTREDDLTAESGVEYISNKKLNQYMSKFKPHTHIAWRHNIELTRAKTYLWCHDLVTNTVESKKNFDKMLCLSEFHKSYVMGKQGVSPDKILVTRNGITPEKFQFQRKPKNPNKLVWMSSPDRGLDRAMLVCDVVREHHPDIELHVYYGLNNLYKYGMADLASRLEKMMNDRPYVKYHGFTEQSKMYEEVSDAVVWVHPCNFIETFCITALEMLALGVFPVTRRLGALANTLADAESKGQAVMLDHDCVTQEEIGRYAYEVSMALREKKWERVSLDLANHDWSKVCDEWIEMMGL